MTSDAEPRVWRRDTYRVVEHKKKLDADMCEYCGLTTQQIAEERLGCIASLQPKQPQPPKPKRRDWRDWPRKRR